MTPSYLLRVSDESVQWKRYYAVHPLGHANMEGDEGEILRFLRIDQYCTCVRQRKNIRTGQQHRTV